MNRIFNIFRRPVPTLTAPSAPAWKVNLLAFGLLILVVLANFYYQVRQAEKAFTDNVKSHSTLLAEVVRLNAAGAVLSRDAVREIMQTFLANASHFIDYLDAVEAFDRQELAALAKEIGLAGIRIIEADGGFREGPAGWFPDDPAARRIPENTLTHARKGSLFYLRYPRFESGSILAGLTSSRFEALQRKVGLSELLETVTGLAGIRYVRLEKAGGGQSLPETGTVRIIGAGEDQVAETRLLLGEEVLVIGMDCRLHFVRMKQIRREFTVFSAVISLAGIICSFLLYAYHRHHLAQVLRFTQTLAKEREDAVLGRATASIAHEIRNPLNAISMGLQRLAIEAESLDDDHRELLANLMGSVKRTDRIITDLNRFAGPLTPKRTPLSLAQVVTNALSLYEREIAERNIRVTLPENGAFPMDADRDLFEILVENLVKNAVEAQEEGGFIRIGLASVDSARNNSGVGNHSIGDPSAGNQGAATQDTGNNGGAGKKVTLTVTNGGFAGSAADPEKILEPYYTTKTRGSGVGLAIVRRIAIAHGGLLAVAVPEPGTLKVTVTLPVSG